MTDILIPILKSPNLPSLLKEIEEYWHNEQKKRHEFWVEHDESQKAEFIEGEIIYHSPVYRRHWMVSTNILGYLIPFVRDNKLGKVAVEKVMIRCTRNDYEPDICFWTAEHAKDFQVKQSAFPPPDFIIEILSDSTEERDRGIKMTDYAAHQVAEYWLIDADKKIIEQYILQDSQYELNQKLKTGFIASQVISGFEMELSQIFEGLDDATD